MRLFITIAEAHHYGHAEMFFVEHAFFAQDFFHFFNIETFDWARVNAEHSSRCHHVSQRNVGLFAAPIEHSTVAVDQFEIVSLEVAVSAAHHVLHVFRHVFDVFHDVCDVVRISYGIRFFASQNNYEMAGTVQAVLSPPRIQGTIYL